jgi:hypothetical protein
MHSPIYAKPLEHLVSRRRESNPRHELGRLGYIPANTTSALSKDSDGGLVTAAALDGFLNLTPIRAYLGIHELFGLLAGEAHFLVAFYKVLSCLCVKDCSHRSTYSSIDYPDW